MNSQKRPKSPGRRAKAPAPGKRASLGFKITPETKKKLQDAASHSGRTQSQEAEYRIERSFDQQGLLGQALELKYGPAVAGMLMVLGETIDFTLETFGIIGAQGKLSAPGMAAEASHHSDRDWLLDPYVYSQAVEALMFMLEELKPAGEPVASRAMQTAIEGNDWSNIPRFVTTPLIQALKEKVTGENPLSRWAVEVRPYLKVLRKA